MSYENIGQRLKEEMWESETIKMTYSGKKKTDIWKKNLLLGGVWIIKPLIDRDILEWTVDLKVESRIVQF